MQTLSFSAYPNPTTAVLNIDYHAAGNDATTLRVFDLTGKEVMTVINQPAIGDNYLQLNVANLANGIYLIEATQGHTTGRVKFVKQ